NLHSISESAAACVSVLLSSAPPPHISDAAGAAVSASAGATETVEKTRIELLPYWSCLNKEPTAPAMRGALTSLKEPTAPAMRGALTSLDRIEISNIHRIE